MTTTLIAISGSLRKGSYNTALLRAAAEVAPAGCTIEIASIAGIPLYDGDLETASGVPAAVTALKARIGAANGLLLATPEYNHGVPGVMKNAMDWLSRGKDTAAVFGSKPVAIMGATVGGGGTRLAQAAWLPTLRALQMKPWYGKSLFVDHASAVFDAEGKITDEKIRKLLTEFVAGFAAYAG
jgi:chromate reductase